MPSGLIVFDYHRFLVVVVLLVELIRAKSIVVESDKREFPTSMEKTMTKQRRHSIFDDKNTAVLGELVR
jgi:ribosomal protein S17